MHRHMPASRSARLVAREVARVRAEAGGRSQFAHVAGALALAVVDVLGRRARQAAADGHDLPAGEGLLLNGLAPPDDVTAIPPAPLSIPRLLSARPAGRDAGTALAWRSAIPSDVERPST
jgi:hypothetical protein